MPKARRRLDVELVRRGLFANAGLAKSAIDNRLVLVGGAVAQSGATLVSAGDELRVKPRRAYVSRGGDKLAGALEDLKVDPSGKYCLDAGAGSGGFTDCLLKNGALHVVAVDVGYGQFDWSLRNDPRVTLLERANLRHLSMEQAGAPLDLLVADLSFTSLASMSVKLAELAADDALMLLLVKPQHESPRDQVSPGGVISDPAVWQAAVMSAAAALQETGFATQDAAPSRVKGATGNQEFFILARRATEVNFAAILRAIDRASCPQAGPR